MFGGLAFLIRGNMAIAASSQGGAMVRVDPRESAALVAASAASVMEMRGRSMPGWLHVSSDDLRTDDDLAAWVDGAPGTRGRCRQAVAELLGQSAGLNQQSSGSPSARPAHHARPERALRGMSVRCRRRAGVHIHTTRLSPQCWCGEPRDILKARM